MNKQEIANEIQRTEQILAELRQKMEAPGYKLKFTYGNWEFREKVSGDGETRLHVVNTDRACATEPAFLARSIQGYRIFEGRDCKIVYQFDSLSDL